MAGTTEEYISHHLTNLTYGQFTDAHARASVECVENCVAVGDWGFALNGEEAAQMGFMAINVDTMGWSVVLGAVFIWIFGRAAKQATTGVPSGLLNGVEAIIEFVDREGELRKARPVGDAKDAAKELLDAPAPEKGGQAAPA